MKNDILEVLIDRDTIMAKVKELGQRISEDYKGKELVVIGVLKGASIFLADLVRHISLPIIIDFMDVSSYGDSTRSSGIVKIIKDVDINIEGKHVLVIEDLIDTGLTLNNLKDLFRTRGALSVKLCTILDKPARRKVQVEVDYTGLTIPDEFVVGYGLDYAGKYRNLPDVCVLKPEVYERNKK